MDPEIDAPAELILTDRERTYLDAHPELKVFAEHWDPQGRYIYRTGNVLWKRNPHHLMLKSRVWQALWCIPKTIASQAAGEEAVVEDLVSTSAEVAAPPSQPPTATEGSIENPLQVSGTDEEAVAFLRWIDHIIDPAPGRDDYLALLGFAHRWDMGAALNVACTALSKANLPYWQRFHLAVTLDIEHWIIPTLRHLINLHPNTFSRQDIDMLGLSVKLLLDQCFWDRLQLRINFARGPERACRHVQPCLGLGKCDNVWRGTWFAVGRWLLPASWQTTLRSMSEAKESLLTSQELVNNMLPACLEETIERVSRDAIWRRDDEIVSDYMVLILREIGRNRLADEYGGEMDVTP